VNQNSDFFDYCANALTYLLVSFLLLTIYGSYMVEKFLLEGLECYADTQMKACNITDLTA